MLDPKQLESLTQKLAEALPAGLQTLRGDVEKNIQATLEATLQKLDLVTRSEFDAQAELLARSRIRIEELQAQIAELESQVFDSKKNSD